MHRSKVAVPAAGAVHLYQTVALPAPVTGSCSPVSVVAPTFVPATEPAEPEIEVALANLSLAGAAQAGPAVNSRTVATTPPRRHPGKNWIDRPIFDGLAMEDPLTARTQNPVGEG